MSPEPKITTRRPGRQPSIFTSRWAVPADQIPAVPPKEGFHGEWSRTDFDEITEDEIIEADYSRIDTLLVSRQTREGGQPVIEVYGNFHKGDSLILTEMSAESGEQERWMVSIPDDGKESHEIRFLAPEGVKNPKIYRIQNGKKTKAETGTFGKYITFDAEGSDVAFSVENERAGGLTGLIAAGAVAAGAAIVLIHAILKKKRKRRKDNLQSTKRKKESRENQNGSDASEDDWLDEEV